MKCLRKITVWVLALYFIGHIGHSNIQLVPSRIIFEKRRKRASASIALTKARQKVGLVVLLMPGAAFLALGCLALRAAIISLGCAFEVLGLV